MLTPPPSLYCRSRNAKTPQRTKRRARKTTISEKGGKRGGAKNQAPRGSRKDSRKSRASKGGGEGGKTSMTVEAGIVKQELTIATGVGAGYDDRAEEPPTPAMIKRNKGKKSNLTKTTKTLTAQEFREKKREVAAQAAEEEKRRKKLGLDVVEEEKEKPRDEVGDMERELTKGSAAKTAKVRTRMPGLQRRTSTSSAALFGHTDVAQNAPEVKEFKFNSTRRKSREGLIGGPPAK